MGVLTPIVSATTTPADGIVPDTASAAQLGRATELVDPFAKVPDTRDSRGLRNPLAGKLAVAVIAVLAAARAFARSVNGWRDGREIPSVRDVLADLDLG